MTKASWVVFVGACAMLGFAMGMPQNVMPLPSLTTPLIDTAPISISTPVPMGYAVPMLPVAARAGGEKPNPVVGTVVTVTFGPERPSSVCTDFYALTDDYFELSLDRHCVSPPPNNVGWIDPWPGFLITSGNFVVTLTYQSVTPVKRLPLLAEVKS